MHYLLRVDAAAYVVDCNPNSEARGAPFVHERAVALVRGMLAARPNATIVLASGTKEGAVWLEGEHSQLANGTAALRAAFEQLQKEAPRARLSFVQADAIYAQGQDHGGSLGRDAGPLPQFEMTVMGTHPTALGMEHFTAFWAPRLTSLVSGA